MGDEVGGDGVHADDGQREGPGTAVPYVGQEVKRAEKQKAPAAAEKNPAWGPNLLNYGADTGHPAEPARGQADDARDGKPADFGEWGVVVRRLGGRGGKRGRRGGRGPSVRAAQDAASDQTEDHGAEGRDETKGRVAAAVVAEPVVRREKIQEPGVEGPGRVGVQAPMSGESGEHLVGFDACFGPAEVRPGQRIEGKEKPVTDEYDCQRGPLDADRAQAE